jgi:hypothetical protein
MSRLSVSSGSTVTLNVIADMPLNVTAADLSGNATVVLPGNAGNVNRPVTVHVVFFPGVPAAGISPSDLLAGGPAASAPAPGPGTLGADVPVSLTVPLPLPLGTVTVVAVGEYAQ